VKGLPDSGWILDYDAGLGPGLRQQWLWIYNNMNSTSGLDQSCVAAHVPTKNVEECMFIETTTLHITTPLFPLQSQFDTWQIQNVLGSNDAAVINAFGKLFETRFKTGVLWNADNGCFLDSCFHHCGYWNSIVIDNTKSGVAFKNWYNGEKGLFFFKIKCTLAMHVVQEDFKISLVIKAQSHKIKIVCKTQNGFYHGFCWT